MKKTPTSKAKKDKKPEPKDIYTVFFNECLRKGDETDIVTEVVLYECYKYWYTTNNYNGKMVSFRTFSSLMEIKLGRFTTFNGWEYLTYWKI
jgi:hypothetical protein